MADIADYPWLQEHWARLLERTNNSDLPHALLFAGPEGMGKAVLAEQLIALVLCETEGVPQACEQCRGCQLRQAGTHPDWMSVSPEAKSQVIKIDQVREVNRFAGRTAQQGGFKLVIISPAQGMNANAANALLKNLEEPSADTLFILLSDQPGRLLPTIRSRCQRIDFQPPERETALAWLKQKLPSSSQSSLELLLALGGGAPLLACKLSELGLLDQRTVVLEDLSGLARRILSPVEVANRWQKYEAVTVLEWLYQLVADLARLAGGGDPKRVVNTDAQALLLELSQKVAPNRLYLYIDRILSFRNALLSSSNPNRLLLLEDLLIGFRNLVAR